MIIFSYNHKNCVKVKKQISPGIVICFRKYREESGVFKENFQSEICFVIMKIL